ncbi:hypothetical protein [Ferrimicrobium sp.]|uniref:hypothetical protein n=1 Tax=Ferrimicrobium sp. TaxID=2926050 RepID=UPI00260610F4|nr:hypothetical protein [Ferrimicrobium sp.]
MTIEYTPTQIIRAHFDEITLWRADGISWAQINKELQLSDKIKNVSALRAIYQYERQRRTTPQYRAAQRWVAAHQREITDLRAQGFSWLEVMDMIPSAESSDGSTSSPESVPPKPPYKILIEIYTSIVGRVASNRTLAPPHETTPNPNLATSTNHDDPPAPQPIPDPTPVALQSPTNPPSQPKTPGPLPNPTPQPVTTQSQEVKGPFTGRMKEYNALFMEADAKRKAEDAKAQRKKEYQMNRKSVFHVKEDPYVSVAELRAEYDKWCKIHSERFSLYHEIPDDDESQADLKFEHQRLLDDAEEMTSGYYKLINARASHRLTNRSKLCVLSTAALACGVYVLADTNTPAPPDAITLYGFDRPDTIPGMSEIPDPVIIRANLTPDEIERRDAAYATTEYAAAQVPASPKRLLAEALILRGAYEFRHNGWIRYDEVVELSGDDIPTPSLCGHPASRTELTLAPPPLPDDPMKDDYPSDHRRDLARQQLKGDWL